MHWDPKIAQELIHYVLRFQKKNGMVHHAVLELLVKPYPYNESQPPLLAWASWRIFEKSNDKLFLEQTYPKLKLYHEWLMKNRQHPDGLFFWRHAYESGIDNSPRFSNISESWVYDTRSLASVDISSYMAMSMEALSKMAKVLGNAHDEKIFADQYVKLKNLMNEKLWDEQDGVYHDWDYQSQKFIRIHTISDLTPMVAGIPDTLKALTMMKIIMDPNYYNTVMPFPSVARSESLFKKDMWYGPVWVNMAYLGVLGVSRYGYKLEADYLSKNVVRGVYETWQNLGHFYEFYDPDRYDITELNRKKGNLWKKLTLGSKPVKDFVGWTGLSNTLVLEYGSNWDLSE